LRNKWVDWLKMKLLQPVPGAAGVLPFAMADFAKASPRLREGRTFAEGREQWVGTLCIFYVAAHQRVKSLAGSSILSEGRFESSVYLIRQLLALRA
jgi:hypothetical protein